MTYYAILLSTNELSGNRFVNAGLGATVDLIAVTLCWYIVEYVDHRKIYMLASIMTAVGVISAPYAKHCKFSSVCTKFVKVYDLVMMTGTCKVEL